MHLEGAILQSAHLDGVDLQQATLAGCMLGQGDLARVRQVLVDFPETLPPTDLRHAFLNQATDLAQISIG